MIYLVTAYGLLSGLAVVLNLTKDQYIPAFCVAFLSAAAFIGGREFYTCFIRGSLLQKLGRCIYALILLAVALYLSGYSVNLFYYVLPGLWWGIIGAAIGFLGTYTAFTPRGRR